MLNSLLKAAGDVGRIADKLQSQDDSLSRLDAVKEALQILKEVKEEK